MSAPFGTPYDFGGAPSGGKFTWNSGVRQTLMHPRLIHLSPQSTTLWSMIPEISVESLSPEWMQVTLASIDPDNAHIDGAEYTYIDQNLPVRKQNICRIQRKTVKLSGASLKDKTFEAVANLKTQQTDVRMRELKRDMNYALWNSELVNTDELNARRFRGLLSSLIGATSPNHDSTATTLTETIFKQTMLKGCYDDGFEATDVIVSAKMQDTIDNFFTNTKPAYIDVTMKEVVSYVKKYDSPWGLVNIVTERDIYLDGGNSLYTVSSTSGPVVALDRQYWKRMVFRPTVMLEPAVQGDYWQGVLQVDWGMQDLADHAGFVLTQKTAA